MSATDGPDASAPRGRRDPRARRAARHPAHEAVGPELRRRRQHGAPHRPGRRGGPDDIVVEVGPGLGSLTLALLPRSTASSPSRSTRCSPRRSRRPSRRAAPTLADRLEVVHADALTVTDLPGPPPTALVANLPYNVSVPVVLRFLELFPTLARVLVMVQLEVAERLAAARGQDLRGAERQGRLVRRRAPRRARCRAACSGRCPTSTPASSRLTRREPPATTASREEVFPCVDAAFAQRRKTLRAALATWAGSPPGAEAALVAAGSTRAPAASSSTSRPSRRSPRPASRAMPADG